MMQSHLRISLLIAGFSLLSGPALGQEPFSRITVSGGGLYDVYRGDVHDAWEPAYGGEVALLTPFYAGQAELAVALHRYEVGRAGVPRFDAVMAIVGWGLDLSPFEAVSWYNGVQVGNYWMAFDERAVAGVRNESELSLGMHSRIQLHVTHAVSVYAAGRVMRTYTAPRFDAAFFSAGLTLTVESPGWLMTILR